MRQPIVVLGEPVRDTIVAGNGIRIERVIGAVMELNLRVCRMPASSAHEIGINYKRLKSFQVILTKVALYKVEEYDALIFWEGSCGFGLFIVF